MMKPITIAAAVLVSTAAFAQQLSERIEVNLVNGDVTVTAKGAPVRNLTRDDFEVFEDGKRQTITNFYASDETQSTVSATGAATAAPAAAAAQPDERSRRKVLVLVDTHHTPRRGRDRALAQLEAM